MDSPKHPFVAVLGGAKVTDKIGVIERFLDLADQILIGGAMCFTFFKAQGLEWVPRGSRTKPGSKPPAGPGKGRRLRLRAGLAP